MKMRFDEIAISELDRGWPDIAIHHRLRPLEVILIVRALSCAVGHDKSGLSGSARAPRALGIVGRRRRHIAQVHSVQSRNVDAKLHRRRAKQCRKEDIGFARLSHLRPLLPRTFR